MNKILFVYPDISTKSGGGVFTHVILDTLKRTDCQIDEFKFPLYSNSRQKLMNQLRHYTMGMTPEIEENIMKIAQHEYDTIIINGSRFGNTIKKIKKKYPSRKIICIFHNMEYHFALNAIKITKRLSSLLTLFVTWVNEKNSIKYSDYVIALNERDSKELKSFYKRGADYILPLCLIDRFDKSRIVNSNGEKIGAFIGSNFYANNKGIKWFCENVSKRINCTIQIIGKGFESETQYFSQYPNIQLIGTVDNVDDYYYNSDFIISPIFDGSGMKTKTAEALMFGKTIFGTNEAFEGYDLDPERVGALCNTEDMFVEKINNYGSGEGRYNIYSRQIFEEKYSQDALYSIICKILN